MLLYFLGIFFILLAGALALYRGRSRLSGTSLACISLTAGCLLSLLPVIYVLWSGVTLRSYHAWSLPYAALAFTIDPLAAFFMLPLLTLSAVCAWYGGEYLHHYKKPTAPVWIFFCVLVAGMQLVLAAANAILFLIVWEVMSLAPYFLVTFEHEQPAIRKAGLIYLVAAHLGGISLAVCFLLLGGASGSFDFQRMNGAALGSLGAALVFVSAVAGCGAKAGFFPFHVWLPEAHPAAPSHISALMSGVLIKMGIYGLLRILTFFDLAAAPVYWGVSLLMLGAVSGVAGVLYALAQHDLKRLLGYSSVENIGIIAIGLGAGLIGLRTHHPGLAVLAFAGALLHLINHAFFKGLLFLGAGAVLQSAGTGGIERLGGLFKRMPQTGALFLIAATAISGLPPLNGFVSEFLIYLGCFSSLSDKHPPLTLVLIGAILALALIGGLAAACFAKAFGIVFLGEPRSTGARQAHDPPRGMLVPMSVLAALCLLIGLFPQIAVMILQAPLRTLTGGDSLFAPEVLAMRQALNYVSLASIAVLALIAALIRVRRRLLVKNPAATAVTWDCGYAFPTARMQYTGSSFADPLLRFFTIVLRPVRKKPRIEADFPAKTALQTEVPDFVYRRIYYRLAARIADVCLRLHWLQPARVHFFAVYIVSALILLMAWHLILGGKW